MQKKKLVIPFFALAALLFAVSLLLYLKAPAGYRRTFVFPLLGSEKPVTEIRYLSREPAQGDIPLYIDELLLGPQTQRARPLFSPGTTCDFCFVREKTLYVGLSKAVLYQDGAAADILDGIALFKANILHNFRAVSAIELFIDNKIVENAAL